MKSFLNFFKENNVYLLILTELIIPLITYRINNEKLVDLLIFISFVLKLFSL